MYGRLRAYMDSIIVDLGSYSLGLIVILSLCNIIKRVLIDSMVGYPYRILLIYIIYLTIDKCSNGLTQFLRSINPRLDEINVCDFLFNA